ncbi:(S)-beta-bisabolene synthase [Dichanthelium oligosanthes]|uniref:(S)-beta-bisabolene synthase n=1 Tax=Dichanthelium oligosanthes TaxID=888268 RepID=A0A1E5WND9_9POAL|nr:(S)-beta-bisabolene synthase [Dichanthelium oligosanthes]
MAAASKVAAKQETGDATVAAAAAAAGPFEPCVWGDFFVTYTPPPSQRSEEWMRERSNQLKGEVRRMFEAGKTTGVAETVRLVDTLERLGIDNHFREEIDAALGRVHSEELEYFGGYNDLHVVALRFRLLRQHGFWVPTDVFDKFRDGTRSFSIEVSSDPVGLLSLYNAAHVAVPGEAVLDDAIALARRSQLADGGAVFPCPRDSAHPVHEAAGETMHYITEYEQEELHEAAILELARLDLNLIRSLHLKELRTLSL